MFNWIKAVFTILNVQLYVHLKVHTLKLFRKFQFDRLPFNKNIFFIYISLENYSEAQKRLKSWKATWQVHTVYD